jgi:hypothetical protein
MAIQIIILNTGVVPGYYVINYALWAVPPADRQPAYANPNATSAWINATTAEITALQNGSVVESVQSTQFPTGTSPATIEAELVSRFNQYQTQISNANPWAYYGSTYNGSTWTLVTQA